MRWERNYPWIVGTLAAGAYVLLFNQLGLPTHIVGQSLTVATFAVGFTGTIGAILITLNSSVIEVLKRRGRFLIIVDYVWGSVRTGFIFIVYTAMFYWLTMIPHVPAYLSTGAAIIWVGLATYASSVFYRAIDISTYLLRSTVSGIEAELRGKVGAPSPAYKKTNGQ